MRTLLAILVFGLICLLVGNLMPVLDPGHGTPVPDMTLFLAGAALGTLFDLACRHADMS